MLLTDKQALCENLIDHPGKSFDTDSHQTFTGLLLGLYSTSTPSFIEIGWFSEKSQFA